MSVISGFCILHICPIQFPREGNRGGAGEGWGTRGVQEGRPKGWGEGGGKFDSNDDKWITSDYMRVQGRRRISFTKKVCFAKIQLTLFFVKKTTTNFDVDNLPW